MKLDDIHDHLAEQDGVTHDSNSNTYLYRVPGRPIFFVFRPIDDDSVIGTSVMGLEEENARRLATLTLDLARTLDFDPDVAIAKHQGLEFPGFGFDALLVRGKSVKAYNPIPRSDVLPKLTVAYFPIFNCEFCGDETVPEAQARFSMAPLTDATRSPAPALAARYRKKDGRRSKNKFMGVIKEAAVEKLVSELPRDGGNVEVENFRHERCVFETDDAARVRVRHADPERTLDLPGALAFLREFGRTGIEQ